MKPVCVKKPPYATFIQGLQCVSDSNDRNLGFCCRRDKIRYQCLFGLVLETFGNRRYGSLNFVMRCAKRKIDSADNSG